MNENNRAKGKQCVRANAKLNDSDYLSMAVAVHYTGFLPSGLQQLQTWHYLKLTEALIFPPSAGCWSLKMTTIPARLAQMSKNSLSQLDSRKRVIQLYRDWYRAVCNLIIPQNYNLIVSHLWRHQILLVYTGLTLHQEICDALYAYDSRETATYRIRK